eukprot:3861353-Prymnesium_polylepis.1
MRKNQDFKDEATGDVHQYRVRSSPFCFCVLRFGRTVGIIRGVTSECACVSVPRARADGTSSHDDPLQPEESNGALHVQGHRRADSRPVLSVVVPLYDPLHPRLSARDPPRVHGGLGPQLGCRTAYAVSRDFLSGLLCWKLLLPVLRVPQPQRRHAGTPAPVASRVSPATATPLQTSTYPNYEHPCRTLRALLGGLPTAVSVAALAGLAVEPESACTSRDPDDHVHGRRGEECQRGSIPQHALQQSSQRRRDQADPRVQRLQALPAHDVGTRGGAAARWSSGSHA